MTKYFIPLLAILCSCGSQYRTKHYIIEKSSVALVILDYQAHAQINGTVNNGAEVAIVFRDASIPVLFLTGEDAADMKGFRND